MKNLFNSIISTKIITYGSGGRRRKLVEKVRTVDLLDDEIIYQY